MYSCADLVAMYNKLDLHPDIFKIFVLCVLDSMCVHINAHVLVCVCVCVFTLVEVSPPHQLPGSSVCRD